MQTASAKILICALVALLPISGCSSHEAAALDESKNGSFCFDLKDGYEVPLCSTSFVRLISQPSAYSGKHVAFKAVLSIEFDECVLHRDYFASENHLDLESVVIKDSQCIARAKSVLGSEPAKLVSVVGRYESGSGADAIQRSGGLVELRVLEAEIAVGR